MISRRTTLFAALLLGIAATVACTGFESPLPPMQQFYFPTGLMHFDAPGNDAGILLVSNANFDKRFKAGSLMAIDLSALALPAFGAPVKGSAGWVPFTATDAGTVLTASFTAELGALETAPGHFRLFSPSRSEGMRLNQVDLTLPTSPGHSPVLECMVPTGTSDRDCASTAMSLSVFETSSSGLPRAPSPYGVSVRKKTCVTADDCGCLSGACPVCSAGVCVVEGVRGPEVQGDVFISVLGMADSPFGSNTNYRGYLVRLDSNAIVALSSNFIDVGLGGTHGIVAGQRWAYTTGRTLQPVSAAPADLVRMIDRSNAVSTTSLESSFRVTEGRGIALSSDERRLFVLGRAPDSMLVASLANVSSASPTVLAANSLNLPAEPNQIVTIARPGRSDLAVITCSGAGSVVIYDDDVGDLVGDVPNIGISPFGIAVDRRGVGARLFVSNFGDGRVAVIDIPDLNRPHDARLVAYIGDQQLCLTQGNRSPELCDGGVR